MQCKSCKKTLSNGNWSDRGTEVYCNTCYEKNFVDDETKQQIFDTERYVDPRKIFKTVHFNNKIPAPTPRKSMEDQLVYSVLQVRFLSNNFFFFWERIRYRLPNICIIGTPPTSLKKPGQNQSSPVAPPPPTSPRVAMPTNLQHAIVASQGSPRAGLHSSANSASLKSSGNSAPTGFNRAKK